MMPRGLCCQAVPRQLLLEHGLLPAHPQDSALAFAELHEVPVCTFLNIPLTHLLYQALPQVVVFLFLFIPVLRFGSTAR